MKNPTSKYDFTCEPTIETLSTNGNSNGLQPSLGFHVDDVPIDFSHQPTYHGNSVSNTPWSVYNGDAFEILSDFPSNSFDCIVTSPPYYWLRDYGVAGQYGLEETIDEYVESIVRTMNQIYRVLKPSGTLFLNLGDTYYSGKGKSHGKDPKSSKRRFGLRAVDKSGGLGIGLKPKTVIGIPWRVALKMSENDWVLRSPIIWHRKHALPEAVQDRPRRTYEYIFMFVKERKYFFNREALIAADEEDMWVITARPEAGGINTAPFPDELVQRCLDIGCPKQGTVLDPFAGSGTTLRVAVNSGRPATGIELNEDFCSYIVKQLKGN
jgi:DNA modification methylase